MTQFSRDFVEDGLDPAPNLFNGAKAVDRLEQALLRPLVIRDVIPTDAEREVILRQPEVRQGVVSYLSGGIRKGRRRRRNRLRTAQTPQMLSASGGVFGCTPSFLLSKSNPLTLGFDLVFWWRFEPAGESYPPTYTQTRSRHLPLSILSTGFFIEEICKSIDIACKACIL